MSPGRVRVLGWIKPDDGVPIPAGVDDYECFGLEPWLQARGVAGVRVLVERSRAENGHGLDQLLGTGDPERLLAPARRLAAQGAEALCWACTSGSFAGGIDWGRAQLAALSAETGLPATSASFALAEAVRSLGTGGVDLLSPYPGPLTDVLRTFLAACGVAVRSAAALGCATGIDSHRLDVSAVVAAFAAPRTGEPATLLIPDSALNTLDLVAPLEASLGRLVVTANQATLWKGLTLLGVPPVVPRGGRLLAAGAR